MSLLSIDIKQKLFSMLQGSTDTDTITDTVTNKDTDTAGSQLLSKTFDIFLAGNQLYELYCHRHEC